MWPERVLIDLSACRRIEAGRCGQLSVEDHPVNRREKQQRRDLGRARDVRLERGEARAADTDVLGHAPQERFVHRRTEFRSPRGLIETRLSDVLATHVFSIELAV